MNCKRLVYSFVFFVLPSFASAQVYISGKIGYGSYSNDNLKSFLEEIQSGLEVDATITDNFPGYYYPEFEALYQINDKGIVGVVVTYYSTGGRIYYEDYSGKIETDFTLNGLGVGAYGEIILTDFNVGTLSLHGKLLIVPNNALLDFNVQIGNDTQSEKIELQSTNIGFQPGFNTRIFLGHVFLEASLGYELNIAGRLELKENRDYFLQDNNGDEVFINWDGARATVGLGLRF